MVDSETDGRDQAPVPSERTRSRIRRVMAARGPTIQNLAHQAVLNATGPDSEVALDLLEMLVDECRAAMRSARPKR